MPPTDGGYRSLSIRIRTGIWPTFAQWYESPFDAKPSTGALGSTVLMPTGEVDVLRTHRPRSFAHCHSALNAADLKMLAPDRWLRYTTGSASSKARNSYGPRRHALHCAPG